MKCDICGKKGDYSNIHTFMWIGQKLMNVHDDKKCKDKAWKLREQESQKRRKSKWQ